MLSYPNTPQWNQLFTARPEVDAALLGSRDANWHSHTCGAGVRLIKRRIITRLTGPVSIDCVSTIRYQSGVSCSVSRARYHTEVDIKPFCRAYLVALVDVEVMPTAL